MKIALKKQSINLYMIKKLLLTIVVLFAIKFNSKSQTNLICNGSFEEFKQDAFNDINRLEQIIQ